MHYRVIISSKDVVPIDAIQLLQMPHNVIRGPPQPFKGYSCHSYRVYSIVSTAIVYCDYAYYVRRVANSLSWCFPVTFNRIALSLFVTLPDTPRSMDIVRLTCDLLNYHGVSGSLVKSLNNFPNSYVFCAPCFQRTLDP